MATQVPIRSVRIPALQRQCLFLRHQRLHPPFAAAASRTFSSTPLLAHRKGPNATITNSAMIRSAISNTKVGPSPTVGHAAARKKREAMVEDIGLLQNTVVRAPLKSLPRVMSKAFRSYMWMLLKAKATAIYSRITYQMYLHNKKGFARYVPVDMFQSQQLVSRAKHMYMHMYKNFNNGNTKALEKLCLEPLALKLHNQIKTRKMNFTWDLVAWKSARIVSHRVSSLGEDFPDTAWRQVVIRLESDQVVTVTPAKGSKSSTLEKPRLSKAVRWVPEEARGKQQQQQQPRQTPKNSTVATAKGETAAPARNSLAATSEIEKRSGKTKRVVEYIVLQIRVIRGIEDDEWKIWGFTRPSTPASIAKDEEYFGKQLDSQAAGIGI